jgi:ATP-independent RNA helicase DbpA
MDNKFDNLALKKELLDNLTELQFTTMTPIQEGSLPHVLEGKDVIAKAKTGSGKTAAFALGILNCVEPSNRDVQALILCPTRELAEQVAAQTRKLARKIANVKVLTICGGVSEYHQEKSLSHGANIIVGTPGRVLRLLKKKSLDISAISTLVLDEADRMLDMGFHDDIMRIITQVPKSRQTLLFSATFPDNIQKLAENILREPQEVQVDTEHEKSTINQYFYELESHKDKNDALLKILDKYRPERFIVFCKTKAISDSVASFLNNNGVYAASIHGDLQQNERTCVLTMFANNSLNALVATDVAARGLDIQSLEAVINYDMSPDPEIYVHRIGRTGRAGEVGNAYGLFVEQEHDKIDAIEEYMKTTVKVDNISSIEVENEYDIIPPMITMYIGGGKKNKLRPGDILGALIGEAGLTAQDVGDINIYNIVSYVAIKSEMIDQAIKSLRNGKIKKRKFRVGKA